MPRIKEAILDWSLIGAMVASADSVVQANFFRGFAEGLKEYDTDYAIQMQFAMVVGQDTHECGKHGKILSGDHLKALENALQMLWAEE